MNLEQIWEELEATARTSGAGLHTRLLTPRIAQDVEAAVDGRNGQRMLMFRFERSVLHPDIDVPESHGLTVKRAVFPRDGERYITLQLSMSDPGSKSIFLRVAEDLFEHVSAIPDSAEVLQSLIRRLAEWYRFMRRQSPTILSKERQRGLVGELDFLLRYAIRYRGPLAAVAAWSGPGLAIHDFEFKRLTVEAKTTVAGGPTEFRVSSERQLDDRGHAFLVIYHPLFTETRESGTSLPVIVDKVRKVIGQVDGVLAAFEEKLADYGYYEVHRKEYVDPGYVDRTRSFYRVTAGFPRLIEADLPPGVGAVSYAVSTVACADFLVAESEIIDRLSGGQE